MNIKKKEKMSLTISVGGKKISNGDTINYYELVDTNDFKIDFKMEIGKYYDVVLKNYNTTGIYFFIINLNSKYPEIIIKYDIPFADNVEKLKLIVYSSNTLSGEIKQYGHYYPIEEHIKVFNLKKIGVIMFNVNREYSEKEKRMEIFEKSEENKYKVGSNVLNKMQRRWCRCLLRAASDLLPRDKNFYENITKNKCLHYGVNISKNDCSDQYVLGNLTLTELFGYAKIYKIKYKRPISKNQMIELIKNYLYTQKK